MSESPELGKLRPNNGDNGVEEPVVAHSSKPVEKAHQWFVGDSFLSKRAKASAWALVVLCLVLLVIVIALAACWPRKSGVQVCDSPECVRAAAEHLEWMNRTVDPCANPRQWACGGWLAANAKQLPARPGWSIQNEISYKELQNLRNIITSMSSVAGGDESLEWRLKTLYQSCMALDIIEQDGSRPLDRIIQHLGGWHVRREWSSHAWSWRHALEILQARYGITPLFGVSLTWRGNQTALHLHPAGLGLPDPVFYLASSEDPSVKAYKTLLKDAALCLDAPTHDAARFSDDIFSFEKRLADLLLGDTEATAEQWMTVKELLDQSMQMPYHSILRAMFPEISITNNTEILVTAPHYMTYLLSITTSTSPNILNDYFTWTLIRTYLPYMSHNFRIIWMEYQSVITGSKKDMERWEFCVRLVQDVAPLATLALLDSEKELVEPRYSHELELSERALIQEMFETIKLKAVESVTTSAHVNGETKSLMIEQVNGLTLQIGLKPHEKSQSFLKDYYRGLATQKHDFFQNIRYSLEYELRLLQNAYNDKELSIVRDNSRSLILMEASYNHHARSIVLPPALASQPYFGVDHPWFVKYARLGVTLGTAVAHSLAIIQPDYSPSYPDYAAPTVHCLFKSLLDSAHANNALPVKVAVALYIKMIGVQLALKAARDSGASDTALPLLDLYKDNLFALSYGQTLCSMHSPEQALILGLKAQVDGETLFNTMWPKLGDIQGSLHCEMRKECPAPL